MDLAAKIISVISGNRRGRAGPIAPAGRHDTSRVDSAVSVLFQKGQRPAQQDIRLLSEESGEFTLASSSAGMVELLANGLTFDLGGLAPETSLEHPDTAYTFGFEDGDSVEPTEAITLRPGPHLAGGGTMPPVVRCLALLAAILSGLPGAQAVVWHPARSRSSPAYFRRSVMRWIEGGVFPGLGLTGLATLPDGGLESEGLALFVGRELRISSGTATSPADTAKLALRLLHWLVENGGLAERLSLTGPSGEPLEMCPLPDEKIVEVRRSG